MIHNAAPSNGVTIRIPPTRIRFTQTAATTACVLRIMIHPLRRLDGRRNLYIVRPRPEFDCSELDGLLLALKFAVLLGDLVAEVDAGG